MRVHFIITQETEALTLQGKSSGHFFNIYITVWCGSNDIRELTKFSAQLDMLIEKPRFKGKVHICADGGTMQDGRPRSVSFPSYTLMAAFFSLSFLFSLKFDTY